MASGAAIARPARFAFLDGARGIAACLVVMRHSHDLWGGYPFRSYLAVDLFFLLSGFVLAHAFESRLSGRQMTPAGFMALRVIRIYPMYALSLALCAAVIVGTPLARHTLSRDVFAPLGGLALNALFLPSFRAGATTLFLFPYNAPAWSLMFELVINAAYAASAVMLSRCTLVVVVAVSGVALACASAVNGGLDVGFAWGGLSWCSGAARTAFGFFAGVLIYRLRVEGPVASAWSWAALIVTSLVLITPSLGHSADALIDVVLVVVVFPMTIAMMARPSAGRGVTVLRALGAASYPLYVLHAPLGFIAEVVCKGHTHAPLGGVVFVVVLASLGILLEQRVDLPLRRRLSRALGV